MDKLYNVFFSFISEGRLQFGNDYIFAPVDCSEKQLKRLFKDIHSYKRVRLLYAQQCIGSIHKYRIRAYSDEEHTRQLSIYTATGNNLLAAEKEYVLNVLGDLKKYPLYRELFIDIWR